MSDNTPVTILLKPIITEKSLSDQAVGKYSFWVNVKANKDQIRSAFVSLFSVKPLSINTYKIKGKTKTDWKKRRPIVKPDRKKAVINVGKDKKIESLTLNTK